MENPTKMDDLGVPIIFGNTQKENETPNKYTRDISGLLMGLSL